MFQILADLDEQKPGSMLNMMKYFYLVPRLGLKEFSTIHPAFLMNMVTGIVNLMGKLSGWNQLVDKYK